MKSPFFHWLIHSFILHSFAHLIDCLFVRWKHRELTFPVDQTCMQHVCVIIYVMIMMTSSWNNAIKNTVLINSSHQIHLDWYRINVHDDTILHACIHSLNYCIESMCNATQCKQNTTKHPTSFPTTTNALTTSHSNVGDLCLWHCI